MRRIFNGNFKVTQKYHAGHIGMDIVGISSKNIVSPVEGVVKSSTIIPKSSGDVTWEWGNYVRVDDAKGNRSISATWIPVLYRWDNGYRLELN